MWIFFSVFKSRARNSISRFVGRSVVWSVGCCSRNTRLMAISLVSSFTSFFLFLSFFLSFFHSFFIYSFLPSSLSFILSFFLSFCLPFFLSSFLSSFPPYLAFIPIIKKCVLLTSILLQKQIASTHALRLKCK